MDFALLCWSQVGQTSKLTGLRSFPCLWLTVYIAYTGCSWKWNHGKNIVDLCNRGSKFCHWTGTDPGFSVRHKGADPPGRGRVDLVEISKQMHQIEKISVCKGQGVGSISWIFMKIKYSVSSIYLPSVSHEPSILTMRRDGHLFLWYWHHKYWRSCFYFWNVVEYSRQIIVERFP